MNTEWERRLKEAHVHNEAYAVGGVTADGRSTFLGGAGFALMFAVLEFVGRLSMTPTLEGIDVLVLL